MNSMRYRVVFNDSLGAWMAVAENVAARGKPSRARSAGALVSLLSASTLSLIGSPLAYAAGPLPVASSAAARTVTNTAGVGINTNGNMMTVTQSGRSAVVNWDSFDVNRGYRVHFDQNGDSSARTLNRIWDANPSVINGQITAPGQVYLINRNGIQFGKDSQIDVGGLIASALNIKVKTFEDGYLSLSGKGEAAFYYAGTLDASGNLVDFDAATPDVSALAGRVPTVRNEGSIRATEGGSIMLFAPRVENAGRIETTGQQVVLAAGSKVYLGESKSTALRGVLVEVDPFIGGNKDSSTVSNTGLKEAMQGIIANRGNITLAAMAVNNDGFLQASTGKLENGSIYLQGRYSAATILKDNEGSDTTNLVTVARQGGEVVLGGNSRIELPVESITEDEVKARAAAQFVPEAGESELVRASRLSALQDLIRKQYTVLKSDAFKQSEVLIDGRTVLMQRGSSIVAPGATVNVLAAGERRFGLDPTSSVDNVANTNATFLSNAVDDPGARVVMEDGATINVSGYRNLAVDGNRNQISATLVSNELKDSPLQRAGILYRKTVKFNLLDVPGGIMGVADASGAVSGLRYSLREMAATGGAVNIQSAGSVVIGKGATIDVSGGSVNYSDALIETTQLAVGKQRFDIGKASQDIVYTKLLAARRLVKGYSEGKSAGSITVEARGAAVMDGDLVGKTTPGIYQTTPGTAPKGGTLIVGDVYGGQDKAGVAGSNPRALPSYGREVHFESGSGLDDAASFWADPLNATVSSSAYNKLSADALVAGGFQNLSVYADGVTVSAGAPMNLLAGSTVTLRSSGDININDDINAAGLVLDAQAGKAGVSAGSIRLADGKSIRAAGMWINDYKARPGKTYTGVRQLDGGAVSLTAVGTAGTPGGPGTGGEVILGVGSMIDVSGGGEINSAGTLKLGNGGAITLNGGNGVTLNDAVLNGFALANGTQVGKGGSLSITAPGIRINDVPHALGELELKKDWFMQGGFSKFTLNAALGNASIADGTQLDLSRSVRNLPMAYRATKTGTDLASVGAVGKLDPAIKDASSFSMSAASQIFASAGTDTGVIEIGKDVLINAGAGGSIALKADRQITVAGALRAQGGTVSMNLVANKDAPDDVADRSIFLTDTASIDVSGKAFIVKDRRGRRSGEVLAGGDIALTVDKGYIVAQQGATIRLDGSTATVDNLALRAPQELSSDAGSLTLDAGSGIAFGAQVSAQGGAPNAAGGKLAVNLRAGDTASTLSGVERIVTVGNNLFDGSTPLGTLLKTASAGTALGNDALLKGRAYVDANALSAQGFDHVTIRSDGDRRDGQIRFVGDVKLAAARQLSLLASNLDINNANVDLQSAYVKLGWLGPNNKYNASVVGIQTPAKGTGRFTVNAAQVDLQGSVSVSGAAQTTLASSGNIRLIGQVVKDDSTPAAAATDRVEGNFSASGNLDLRAAQIYPGTLSDFTISLAPGTASDPSLLRVSGTGPTPQVPLTANGRLALVADNIEQGGVLRAPFGTIDLGARSSLTLQAGSLTSASAEGAVIPYGELNNGTDWTITPSGGLTKTVSSVPVPTVALRGATVVAQAGSKVDVSGGGDLSAAEWVPGAGGSKNVLAQANTYAILPSYGSAYAPVTEGLDKLAGTQITLGANSGVPAGTYTLLPASYALLPGAYKVTLLKSYQDAAPQLKVAQALGGSIVTGQLSVANTGIKDSHTQGVLVESGDITRKRSEYTEVLASTFFEEQAARTGKASAHDTADGGHLILSAIDSIQLAGKIAMEAATQGAGKKRRGGMLDVSLLKGTLASDGSPRGDIVIGDSTIVASAGTPTLRVSEKDIADIGAASILIGGERSVSADGATIAVTARELRYNGQGGLGGNANEVILAGVSKVSVEAGSRIETAAYDSARQPSLQASVKGDGALLRVASDDADVIRTGVTGTQGKLVVQSGATLKGYAVQADATLDSQLAKDSAASATAFSLGARQINFGGAGSTGGSVTGTDLSGDLLASVAGSAQKLTLRGYEGIRFNSGLVLGDGQPINALRFDAPSIEWASGSAGVVQINAQSLTLTNTTGKTGVAATTGAGSLALNASGNSGAGANAGVINVAAGDVALLGFGSTSLSAQRGVVFSGTGNTNVGGDLVVAAPMITAESGARHVVSAAGRITTTVGSGPVEDAVAAGGGAAIKFDAASIDHGSNIASNSGTVTLNARTGDVHLQNGSRIDVSSMQTDFDGTTKSTDAGSITLSSTAGSVQLDSGAVLDLQGKGDSSAGSLNVLVPKGEAKLAGTLNAGVSDLGKIAGAAAGRFYLDAGKLASLDDLNRLTAAFTGERSVRLRVGDLKLSAGDANKLTASKVNLYADAGSIYIDGTIDASGFKGGSIDLAARRDFVTDANGNTTAQGGEVKLGANAVLDAHATGDGEEGGTVRISVSGADARIINGVEVDPKSGTLIEFANGSKVDVRGGVGGADGKLVLNAPRLFDASAYNPISGTGAPVVESSVFPTPPAPLQDYTPLVAAVAVDTGSYLYAGTVATAFAVTDPSKPDYTAAANAPLIPNGTRVVIVAGINNSSVSSTTGTTFSINGSSPYRIAASAISTTALGRNQLIAGASYELVFVNNPSGSVPRYWYVDTTKTKLGVASVSVLPVSTPGFTGRTGDIVYFKPQLASFGGASSNTTNGGVLISSSGLSGNAQLFTSTGGIVAQGDLLAGGSYAAVYDKTSNSFSLLSSVGQQDTIKISNALTSVPADTYDIRFTPGATNTSSNVQILLNDFRNADGSLPLLYASDGSPLAPGALVAGQSYSAGRLSDGRYALRASTYEQLTVTGASDPTLVVFSLSSLGNTSGSTLSSVRLSVNGAGAVPLLNDSGGSVDFNSLVTNTLYVARQVGGSYQLVSTSNLESSVPISNRGVVLAGRPNVEVNAVKTYTAATLDAALQSKVQLDAQQFSQSLPAIATQLNLGSAANLVVRPGIEVRSVGDMTLATDWNLAAQDANGNYLWRYNGNTAAGSLTLRAGGDLKIGTTANPASLNDGFANATAATPGSFANGWSYTLVGGADLDAASSLATVDGGSGKVIVSQKVRTATGEIRVAAASDIDISSTGASVYSSGQRTTTNTDDMVLPNSADKGYLTVGGGDVSLIAGRDILGQAATDQPTTWLWRVSPEKAKTAKPAAWLVLFDRFNQQVGALGGGDVSVRAGRDISNVAASLPTQGVYTYDSNGVVNGYTIRNGGDLDVRADRDILGGQYMVERGTGKISAAGSMAPGKTGYALQLYAADTQFKLKAGVDLQLDSVRNTPMVEQSTGNASTSKAYTTFWNSYTSASALDARSAAGNIRIFQKNSADAGVLPANLQLVAASGGIDLGGVPLPMFPSSRGQLGLFAEKDVLATDASGANTGGISMLDLSPTDLADPLHASRDSNGFKKAFTDVTAFTDNGNTSLGVRVTGSTLVGNLHDGDTQPARIVSRSGDVSGAYFIAKPVNVSAGRDVKDMSLTVQNLTSNDVSSVSAGRDLAYSNLSASDLTRYVSVKDGKFNDTTPAIKVFGPGLLEITVGRNVDLANSGGIVSKGPGANSYLPDSGASIRVVAGKPTDINAATFAVTYLNASDVPAFMALSKDAQLNFAQDLLRQRFIDAYLGTGGQYLTQWQEFARSNGVSDAAMSNPALADSKLFNRFRYQVLWAELSASGIAAAARNADAKANPGKYTAAELAPEVLYADGFKAIELMGIGDAFRVNGNVRMLFSQIRTQAGGNADLLVPGGSLDIGATQSPASSFVPRDTSTMSAGQLKDYDAEKKAADARDKYFASKLGLIANQGNSNVFARDSINVNTSRWFAIDGGELMGWASYGSIDAGKGSRTAQSGSSQRLDVDRSTGRFSLVDGGASSGSGIASIFNRPITSGGNVGLYAPRGSINAGEAGIRAAGNVYTGGTVIGGDFIVSVGTSTVPAAPPAPALAVSAPDSTSGTEKDAATEAGAPTNVSPKERSALLTVEVLATDETSSASAVPESSKDEKQKR
ncbi:filamentous hemagglutinin family protein [Uliginosibacterium sp. H3]|uniref:Filamentous hemagglutinin family protein n=1 Tax=Uliginosibacterium silvisoli TaxID=3114758 RepID=A0ABU6K560_9RHOO|nr:filamentous hemagglutinin family protein [Uliginosibacterium sp. H3]